MQSKQRRVKNEKNEKDERDEKGEKGEQGFVGWLINGLILIIIGIFSLLSASGYLTGATWPFMLVLIGIVIIIAAAYIATTAKRRYPRV